MNTALYLRTASITLNGLEIPFDGRKGLRFSFDIQKSTSHKIMNRAHIQISNLNQKSRDQLSASVFEGVGPFDPAKRRVYVVAGYRGTGRSGGSYGLIYSGYARNVVHTYERGDWITEIIASDTIVDEARTKIKLPSKTTYKALCDKLVGELKKTFTDIDTKQITERAAKGDFSGALGVLLEKPLSVNGPILETLNKFLGPAGFEAFVEDEELVLLHLDETRKFGTAIELSPQTGLIGKLEPVRDDKLPNTQIIKGTSLLRHELKIGSLVEIKTKLHDGLYKIRKIKHHGDTYGANWYTEFEAVANDGFTIAPVMNNRYGPPGGYNINPRGKAQL